VGAAAREGYPLMPRECTICHHESRQEIDEALVDGTAFGALAAKYGVSKDAIGRHKRNHVPAKLVMAKAAEEVAEANTLLEQLQSLQRRTLAILSATENTSQKRTALAAIAEARRNLEVIGQLTKELNTREEKRPLISPVAMQVIINVLAPYPDLSMRLADALEPLEELEEAG
jgi:hypothetical protein